MDKQAQQAVAIFMAGDRDIWDKFDDAMREHYLNWSGEVLNTLEDLGYRKLPKGQPPLVSVSTITIDRYTATTNKVKAIELFIHKAIEAQRKADIKFYTQLSN